MPGAKKSVNAKIQCKVWLASHYYTVRCDFFFGESTNEETAANEAANANPEEYLNEDWLKGGDSVLQDDEFPLITLQRLQSRETLPDRIYVILSAPLDYDPLSYHGSLVSFETRDISKAGPWPKNEWALVEKSNQEKAAASKKPGGEL